MMLNRTIQMACLAALLGAPRGLAQDIPVAQPESKSRTYVLSPNDVVDIKVYQEDDLTTKARVSRDGTISFPLVGVVRVGGKTIQEAGEEIRQKLDKDYLVNPQVTVIVSEYSKRRFTVLGQVQKPGSFEIPGDESMTLFEAIALAGGFTRLADKSHVKVTRVIGDKTETMTLDAKHEAAMPEAVNFQIHEEDTVTIPERFF